MSLVPQNININLVPIALVPSGGTSAVPLGSPSRLPSPNPQYSPAISPTTYITIPKQVIGLIPLTECAADECRKFEGECYFNPVFGKVGGTNYENDLSYFYLSDDLLRAHKFVLQKLDRVFNVWNDLVNITNLGTYGIHYNFGSIANHPTYFGFKLDWEKVIQLQGAGFYRIKIQQDDGACTQQVITAAVNAHSTFKIDSIETTDPVSPQTLTIFGNGVAIMPLYTCFSTDPDDNMLAIITSINSYQSTLVGGALYKAIWNASTHLIDIYRLDGVDCTLTFTEENVTIIKTNFTGGTPPVINTISVTCVPFCLISEPFHLKVFNCKTADRTVRFSVQQSGVIGSHLSDGSIYDLCNATFYDSIRVNGIFGHKKGEYDQVLLEYQNGLIDEVRDELVLKYIWASDLLPQYIHDRLMAYGLMTGALFVDDYNSNNSDYNIKNKRIVKDGSYEPSYNIKNRKSSVIVNFKEGIQSIIKSTSCP